MRGQRTRAKVNAMKISDIMKESAELNPQGGVRLSSAACGFLGPEIEALIAKYEKEVYIAKTKDPLPSPNLGMIESHLSGLREIKNLLDEGFKNR
jgi:hypothetical protein